MPDNMVAPRLSLAYWAAALLLTGCIEVALPDDVSDVASREVVALSNAKYDARLRRTSPESSVTPGNSPPWWTPSNTTRRPTNRWTTTTRRSRRTPNYPVWPTTAGLYLPRPTTYPRSNGWKIAAGVVTPCLGLLIWFCCRCCCCRKPKTGTVHQVAAPDIETSPTVFIHPPPHIPQPYTLQGYAPVVYPHVPPGPSEYPHLQPMAHPSSGYSFPYPAQVKEDPPTYTEATAFPPSAPTRY